MRVRRPRKIIGTRTNGKLTTDLIGISRLSKGENIGRGAARSAGLRPKEYTPWWRMNGRGRE